MRKSWGFVDMRAFALTALNRLIRVLLSARIPAVKRMRVNFLQAIHLHVMKIKVPDPNISSHLKFN
jgi:hypothetical protein